MWLSSSTSQTQICPLGFGEENDIRWLLVGAHIHNFHYSCARSKVNELLKQVVHGEKNFSTILALLALSYSKVILQRLAKRHLCELEI
jgi:hypothetical protein